MALRWNQWSSMHEAISKKVSKIAYLCEACGAAVTPGSVSCPECKRLFYGIRCPRCQKEGKPETFLSGCPSCGYLMDNVQLTLESYIKHKPHWPAKYYWLLSTAVLLILSTILYFWLSSK